MACNYDFRKYAKNRVVIQEATNIKDDLGGFVNTWVDQSNVYAEIKPLTGRELFLQEQQQTNVRSRFVIRYQSALKDITAKRLRISFDDRFFPVVYIRNLESDLKHEGKVYQELFCQENKPEVE